MYGRMGILDRSVATRASLKTPTRKIKATFLENIETRHPCPTRPFCLSNLLKITRVTGDLFAHRNTVIGSTAVILFRKNNRKNALDTEKRPLGDCYEPHYLFGDLMVVVRVFRCKTTNNCSRSKGFNSEQP